MDSPSWSFNDVLLLIYDWLILLTNHTLHYISHCIGCAHIHCILVESHLTLSIYILSQASFDSLVLGLSLLGPFCELLERSRWVNSMCVVPVSVAAATGGWWETFWSWGRLVGARWDYQKSSKFPDSCRCSLCILFVCLLLLWWEWRKLKNNTWEISQSVVFTVLARREYHVIVTPTHLAPCVFIFVAVCGVPLSSMCRVTSSKSPMIKIESY